MPGSTSGDSASEVDVQDSHEKIFVTVRLRPLNEKELERNDVSDWDCINGTTILFRNSPADRAMFPLAYTFDRVFGPECSTTQVYEEAAKTIALSVLNGINSSIFAYGQTSSGKTHTMSGITQYAVADIYDYIDSHPERDFVLKFSAMEIYNEVVKDLLSSDSTPLRLLDDPARGTVVERLTEVTIRDSSHLKELLYICEAQRKTGETALNEMSSRSHQILCLTIESEAHNNFGEENSSALTASVNFVDLAGSERSSQSSAGMRQKEGCHINRSLLTLGTVIRRLGKGRGGHVPFRDSKLTRILQNSLGGNARTAIICTMSPAHSHVEQSRSTLAFAGCAKQIRTKAKVNVLRSEKSLVTQLRREIARLENEVRTLGGSLATSDDTTSALKERELLVEKLNKEISELNHQRIMAQSRLEYTLGLEGASQASKSSVDVLNHEKGPWPDEYSASGDVSPTMSHYPDRYEGLEDQYSENYEDHFLSDDTSPRLYIDKYFGPVSPDPGLENIAPEAGNQLQTHLEAVLQRLETDFNKINGRNTNSGYTSSAAVGESPCSSDEDTSDRGVNASSNTGCSEVVKENEKTSQNEAEDQGKPLNVEPETNCENLQMKDWQSSNFINRKEENIKTEASSENMETKDPRNSNFMNKKEENSKTAVEACKAKELKPCVAELNEVFERKLVQENEDDWDFEDVRTSKNPQKTTDGSSHKDHHDMQFTPDWHAEFERHKKEITENSRKTADGSSAKDHNAESTSNWHAEFERQKKEIIELWAVCHVPLVYRTYFLLLFKGDPSDKVYMEVELRRLSFLKQSLQGNRAVKDDQFFTEASSAKALNRERHMLSKQMFKKFSGKERKALYQKWGINPKTKQRRLQLCRLLWTDPINMEHVKESAAIVAKLAGIKDRGNAPKELVSLNLLQKPDNLRSFNWRRHSLPSII